MSLCNMLLSFQITNVGAKMFRLFRLKEEH